MAEYKFTLTNTKHFDIDLYKKKLVRWILISLLFTIFIKLCTVYIFWVLQSLVGIVGSRIEFLSSMKKGHLKS